jgi:hypothetical protein
MSSAILSQLTARLGPPRISREGSAWWTIGEGRASIHLNLDDRSARTRLKIFNSASAPAQSMIELSAACDEDARAALERLNGLLGMT